MEAHWEEERWERRRAGQERIGAPARGRGSLRLPHRGTAVSGCGSEAEVRLRLSAPPIDGEANRELVRFLARACGAARADVQVVRGHRSRDKVVAVEKEGLTLEALLEELRKHV